MKFCGKILSTFFSYSEAAIYKLYILWEKHEIVCMINTYFSKIEREVWFHYGGWCDNFMVAAFPSLECLLCFNFAIGITFNKQFYPRHNLLW